MAFLDIIRNHAGRGDYFVKITELKQEYKKGNSAQRLAIWSDVITITVALITLVTGQLFAFKFVFDENTPIRVGLYVTTLGVSLGLIYIYLTWVSFINKTFQHFVLRYCLFLVMFGGLILVIHLIWEVALTQ